MNISTFMTVAVATFFLFSAAAQATGVLPESSIVIVEESDGEGAMNILNTDNYPVLLLTTLINIEQDKEKLLIITPPAARVEPGKTQRVRFMLTSQTPLKTERLKRVIFEGIPPQQKDQNVVRMPIRQNLPVLIHPSGLAHDSAPWKRLIWSQKAGSLTVSNPSPYVVRLAQGVTTLPDRAVWMLPNAYILPGEQIILTPQTKKRAIHETKVRLSPATTWGFTVDSYDASLVS